MSLLFLQAIYLFKKRECLTKKALYKVMHRDFFFSMYYTESFPSYCAKHNGMIMQLYIVTGFYKVILGL